MRRIATALAATSLIVSGLVVEASSAGAAAKPFTSLTPTQMLQTSLANARKVRSGTASVTASTTKFKNTQVLSVVAGGGEQRFHQGPVALAIRVIGSTCYVSSNAAGLELMFGVANSNAADKWVAIPSSNAAFVDVVVGISFSDLLAAMTPLGKLTASKPMKLGGQTVIGITGVVNPKAQLTSGKETVYLSTKAPYLPVKEVATGSEASSGGNGTVTYLVSKWGATKVPAVPTPVTQINATDLQG